MKKIKDNLTVKNIEKTFMENLEGYENKFGFVCFFGSLNLENDLDIFISPKKEMRKGAFMKELINFLEKIKKEIKEKEVTIIWHSTYEEEIEYLSGNFLKKDSIKIHVSSFPDLVPTEVPNIKETLKNSEKVLLGKPEEIEKINKTNIDYYYNYLFISNCLLSNYPKKLEKEKVYSKINHIYKCLTGKKNKLTKSPKEEFLICCDFLDSLGR